MSDNYPLDYTERRDSLSICLKYISKLLDDKYQKRVWVLYEGPEVEPFNEFVNEILERLDILIEDAKYFFIEDRQKELLKKISEQIDNFYDLCDDPAKFKDIEEWNEIQTSARQVLKAFENHL